MTDIPTYRRSQRNFSADFDMMEHIELLETRTKEAVETLRKGFKSGDPTTTAAAIILAIAQLEGHGE